MENTELAAEFYVDDHALLFAALAKHILESTDEKQGLAIVRQGVTEYGLERGLRYAGRCLANGDELNVANYMAYSELVEPKGWNKSLTRALAPYKFDTVACGWAATWKKYGMLEYGKHYCTWIDASLVRGFNPEIELEVNPIMSHGHDCCSFTWKNFSFATQEEADKVAKRRRELLPGVGRDFLYHCAHLFSTMCRAVYFASGAGVGRKITSDSLDEYAVVFGNRKKEAIRANCNRDFLEI
ncbi:MAG: L-2-amino-thiazoline-4-carboxylic acid hydrolase [Deltaproteobacteria bacterium]|jgi:hypothetical protein|nr:L-2-amino-thiazoline-4-carboxylic acid hydrolase [Deltaproteobacteria bacterium]